MNNSTEYMLHFVKKHILLETERTVDVSYLQQLAGPRSAQSRLGCMCQLFRGESNTSFSLSLRLFNSLSLSLWDNKVET